ncbi:UPAR/Ly6 domain-containing protein crim-like [Lineus longissimus]|uniref:UPAR/Ly6 domain-containing protein crim-like n=1 Tax=Lineus longissimus TaxID=88925 RepID=UPI002B4CFAF7
MWQIPTFLALYCAVLVIHKGEALYCYQCDSSQAGCGESLDIRLQRWTECEAAADQMCVRVTTKVGTQMKITRGCMTTLLQSTEYRLDMPILRRQNYCDPGKNTKYAQQESDGRGDLVSPDHYRLYCFCNDWSGCNGASGVRTSTITALLLAALVTALVRFLH